MTPMPFKRLARRLYRNRTPQQRRTEKDEQLAQRLLVAFESDLEQASTGGIHFYVKDATVTLYGVARHALDRDLIVSFVERFAGVRRVISHLHLAHPPSAPPQET